MSHAASQALSQSLPTVPSTGTQGVAAPVIPLRPTRRLGRYDLGENGCMDDFEDLTVDELRELPNRLQLGLDLSVLE